MALNKYMHPRNIYKNKKPDYKQLAVKYPEFRKHVFQDLAGNIFLDYKYPPSLKQLTVTLLKEDFSLDVDLPLDRLIPTIPLRLNYILWLEDILGKGGDNTVRGIDIGTGASCIYPLLGCKLNNWSFLATEVDEQNFKYAEKNVTTNKMDDKITVKRVTSECILFDALEDSDQQYDFCMCNPPFFTDHLESQAMSSSRSADRPEPRSVSTASDSESIVRGGEVEFVKKMVADSLKLKSRIKIYTTMVGKKTSLPDLKEELKENKIPKYSTTEFCQGKTMRWGLAWTFDKNVNFPKSLFQQSKKEKPPLVYPIPEDVIGIAYEMSAIVQKIKQLLEDLKIHYEETLNTKAVVTLNITAKENTWSHQRRKRREQLRQKDQQTALNDNISSPGKLGLGGSIPNQQTESVDNVSTHNNSSSKGSTLDENETSSHTVSEINNDKSREIISKSFTANSSERSNNDDVTEKVSEEIKNNGTKESDTQSTNSMELDLPRSECICGEVSERKRKRSGDDSTDEVVKSKQAKITSPERTSLNEGEKIDVKSSSTSDEKGSSLTTQPDISGDSAVGSKDKDAILTVKPVVAGDNALTAVYEPSNREDTYLLRSALSIKKVVSKIHLEMVWVDGKQKDSMQQVLQFLKNKIPSAKMDNNNVKPNKS